LFIYFNFKFRVHQLEQHTQESRKGANSCQKWAADQFLPLCSLSGAHGAALSQ
jgi:hypothetical protein